MSITNSKSQRILVAKHGFSGTYIGSVLLFLKSVSAKSYSSSLTWRHCPIFVLAEGSAQWTRIARDNEFCFAGLTQVPSDRFRINLYGFLRALQGCDLLFGQLWTVNERVCDSAKD
jgi:hypothetical protein